MRGGRVKKENKNEKGKISMNIDRFALGRLTNPFYRPGETGLNSLGGTKIEKRELQRGMRLLSALCEIP